MNILSTGLRSRRLVGQLAAATLFLAASCTAPRSITTSGKVTPKGEFRAGYNVGFNVATEPLSKANAAAKSAAQSAAQEQRVDYNQTITDLQTAALAYALDPVQPTNDLSIRYGVVPRLDVGYKYAFGSHVFDTQYQFLGPTGTVDNPGQGAASGTTYGSVGLQFASQRGELPSVPFLSDLDALLNFRATRRDLLVPVTFSQSFGPEEEIGALSYGLVYGRSWVSYGFAPDKIYTGSTKVPELPTQKRSFSSFGGFVNVKVGYRYAYLVPAMSVFYQNYGDYALLNGQTASLSGFTFVPSLGLQVRIPNFRK